MRDVIGEMGWGMMGGGYAGRTTSPEIGPAGLPFLAPPPPLTKAGRQERQTINEPKKECLFCI